MKSFSVLIAIAFSVLFFACEEETIPIPLPPPSPTAANEPAPTPAPTPAPAPAPTPTPAPEPTPTPTPTPTPKPKPAPAPKAPPPVKEPPAKTITYYGSDDIEQSRKGIFIIQVGTYPTEASAKRTIKKLSDGGIKAYNAKVENPDPDKGMFGTYHRVRVGFFDKRASAEEFAKSRLEPLGYKWWVDKSRNDNIGKQTYSQQTYSQTYSYSEPEPPKQQEPMQMSEQEKREAERAAAIAAAKEEYKAIAKAAMASTPAKAAEPKAASPQTKAKVAEKFKKPNTTKEAEIDSRGRVKMKSNR